MLSQAEKGLLDKLISQARVADADPPDDDVKDPDNPPPEEPEEPPYDPEHPRPGDPDDPDEDEDGPDEPEKPEKPKPDKEKCDRLKADLANAEQALKEARERAEKWNAEFERWQEESRRLSELLKEKLMQGGLETLIPLIGRLGKLGKVLPTRIDNVSTLAEIAALQEKLDTAHRKTNDALRARKVEEAEIAARREEIGRIREEMAAAGCT